MTVESALKDWYEFKTQNGTTNGWAPSGYQKLGTGDGGDSPYYLGYLVVERASTRLPEPLAASFSFHILSGGTAPTFLEEAHKARVRLFAEIKKVMGEWADRIDNEERGRKIA